MQAPEGPVSSKISKHHGLPEPEAAACEEEQTAQPSSNRTKLIGSLFALLDKNHDRYLDVEELRVFAAFQGFDGTEEEWRVDYEELCKEHHHNPILGVPREGFEVMLEDKSDSGCFCEDDEIEGFLHELQTANSVAAEAPAQGSPSISFFPPPGLELEASDKHSKQRSQETPLGMQHDKAWHSDVMRWQGKDEDAAWTRAAWWQCGQQDNSWKTKDGTAWWSGTSTQKSSMPLDAEKDPWHEEIDPWQADPGNDPWQQEKNVQRPKGYGKGQKRGNKGLKNKGGRTPQV